MIQARGQQNTGRMSVWSYLLAGLPNAGLQRFVAKGEFICKAAKQGDERINLQSAFLKTRDPGYLWDNEWRSVAS